MLKKIITLLLLFTAGLSSVCQAQEQFGEGEYPDFKRYFGVLEKNRITYNQYNDSIFLIKDHDQWVSFFRRRAQKNHQIFAANKELIGTLTNYFKTHQGKVPEEAYVQLYYGLDMLSNDNTGDPFIVKTFCDILEKHYQETQVPDSMDYSGWVNVVQGVNYYNISRLGKDEELARIAYEHFKKAAAIQHPKTRQAIYAKVEGMENLMYVNWLTRKFQTVEEYQQNKNELYELLKDSMVLRVIPAPLYDTCIRNIRTSNERLVRNVYLADTTVLDKQVADSLMRRIVAVNRKNPKLSMLSDARTMLMEVKLGMKTYAEAMELARKRYLKVEKDIGKNELYDPVTLQNHWSSFLNYFYFNDMADIPVSKKQKYTKEMCEIILKLYQHRKDNQYNNTYITSLNTFTTYSRIIKYLTEQERIYYLNALNVSTQVTTYAHSLHVAMIAKTLMESILNDEPSLLLGTQNFRFVEDIKSNRKQLVDFIHDAAMYHDLGKNSIISVVNNDYRPLTDEEFAIIKRHPELGLQYLEIAPSLAKFHDTTLGHHKWYNGKGGYPDSFDNTKSPIRMLIDIITLSDCMQAATERVGRNYKGDKTFDTVMAEFRRDAGVRYNPQLVEFIDKHPGVGQKLAALINDGWVEIYYKIYSEFIK